MHVGADARVDPDGADVDGLPPVAVDDVQLTHLAVQQFVEYAEAVLLRAEAADEIVARAAREMGDRDVASTRRAADALVERSVAAAGIDAQLLSGCRVCLDLPAGVHRRRRRIDLKAAAALRKRPGGLRGDLPGAVAASGHGIDDKQMLHGFSLSGVVFLTDIYTGRT